MHTYVIYPPELGGAYVTGAHVHSVARVGFRVRSARTAGERKNKMSFHKELVWRAARCRTNRHRLLGKLPGGVNSVRLVGGGGEDDDNGDASYPRPAYNWRKLFETMRCSRNNRVCCFRSRYGQ